MIDDEVITTTEIIDLKDIIDELVKGFPQITDIYLFGSRAYKTNSTRSDIDLIYLVTRQSLQMICAPFMININSVIFFMAQEIQLHRLLMVLLLKERN